MFFSFSRLLLEKMVFFKIEICRKQRLLQLFFVFFFHIFDWFGWKPKKGASFSHDRPLPLFIDWNLLRITGRILYTPRREGSKREKELSIVVGKRSAWLRSSSLFPFGRARLRIRRATSINIDRWRRRRLRQRGSRNERRSGLSTSHP